MNVIGRKEEIKELEASDFISAYTPFGEGKVERYKLTDPFCLFYLYFIDGHKTTDPQFWQNNNLSPRLNTWRGYAFEEICFAHIPQIKAKLGITGVSSTESSWIIENNAHKTANRYAD